jgi:hypothetical protein
MNEEQTVKPPLGIEPIDPDAATFEVTMTKEEHDIILSLWVDAKDEPK